VCSSDLPNFVYDIRSKCESFEEEFAKQVFALKHLGIGAALFGVVDLIEGGSVNDATAEYVKCASHDGLEGELRRRVFYIERATGGLRT